MKLSSSIIALFYAIGMIAAAHAGPNIECATLWPAFTPQIKYDILCPYRGSLPQG